MSFLFLLDCNGVCQKCDEAKTELGGYCLCYPNGYYSAGVHVEKRGVCILPPGEDATSIPRMDDVQPDHIKKPKKLHAEDGPHSNSDDGDDTAEECIQTVAIAAMRGDLKGIQNCLDVGWDVNAKDMIGTTALHHAAYNGKVNAIALLIKAGADMNAKNKDGDTALDVATRAQNRATMHVLKEATPLSKFLKSISSEKYELNLVNCDYTTISELKDASSDDLKECGLSPKARKSIIKGIKSYKDEL